MEFRGIMGGFYRISEWIMRLSAINVLWVVCSIPVFFLVLTALVSESPDALMAMLIPISIVIPFTLFPATAAMFAVARKWVTGDEDVPLFKTFFRSYKENYVQSMLGGLIFVFIYVLIFVNYKFYLGQTNTLQILSVLFIVFSFIMLAAIFNFFSIMVHLHMKIFQIIKNAILITIGNPITSVTLIICNGVILYISFFKFTFLIPFFMGSVMATFSFWQFNRSFQKLQDKQQAFAEKEQAKLEESEKVNEEDPESELSETRKIDLNK